MGIFEEKAYKGVLCSKNSECGKNNHEIGRLGKIILKSQKKPFLLSYYMVYWIPKWMICKIGFYASSVWRMGSCRQNEKYVLRYEIRTRCSNIREYLILCRAFSTYVLLQLEISFFVLFYNLNIYSVKGKWGPLFPNWICHS